MENDEHSVDEPSSRSFGLKVNVASIEQQLGVKAAFEWNAAGLRCVFAIPRTELAKSRVFNPSLVANGGTNAVVDLRRKDKPRVLLVEDEALVAMMIQDSLTEFGFQVIGPLSTA